MRSFHRGDPCTGMVAVDSEVKVVAAEVAGLVAAAAAAALVAVEATEVSKRSSPGSGTRCTANSNSTPCTSPCSRENPRLPRHCHGLSCTSTVSVRVAAVQRRTTAGLYPRTLEEVATHWIVAAAFGAQVVAGAGRRWRWLHPGWEGAVTGLGPMAVVEMAAVAVEEVEVEEEAVEEAAVDCMRCTLCSGTSCTGNPQDRHTNPRRLPQKNLRQTHGPGYTTHRPVYLTRAWRARKREGATSGRAAFRECHNAGNRPASWNGRTAAGERLATGAARPKLQRKFLLCKYSKRLVMSIAWVLNFTRN